MNAGLFSSAREDWETPQDLFESLDRKFGFLLDVAASADNAKCARFYDIATDGLKQPWTGRNWMNPPYGRKIGVWCAKADAEADKGNLTVALLPARTETKWFHDHCARWHIVFVRGRVRFSGSNINAPFPNMIVFFGIER